MYETKRLRNYVKLSVFIGFYFLFTLFLFRLNFGTELYGTVEVSLFKITVVNVFGDNYITNLPLISFIGFFVFNSAVLFFFSRKTEVEDQLLKEIVVLNTAFTLILVVGQIIYVAMIPENINGILKEYYIFTDFPFTTDILVRAINITYVVSLIYIVYNMYVLVKTMPAKVDIDPSEKVDIELEEEKLLRQFTNNQ